MLFVYAFISYFHIRSFPFWLIFQWQFAGDKFSQFFPKSVYSSFIFWLIYFIRNKILIWKFFQHFNNFISLLPGFHNLCEVSERHCFSFKSKVSFLPLKILFLCIWCSETPVSRSDFICINTGWDSKAPVFYGLMYFTGFGKFPASISSNVPIYILSSIYGIPVTYFMLFLIFFFFLSLSQGFFSLYIFRWPIFQYINAFFCWI